MKITLELTGTPDQLRDFLLGGIGVISPRTHAKDDYDLAGEALERAVSHGATGLILGDRCRLDNAAAPRIPQLEVAGTVDCTR